uniref:Cleavage stimulation factor, 3' pre-RNA, subunit 2 n=1 Tax=Erpetoichthys calabaricus TaxID=27687 RepID=A0A8C4SNW8_ERPCA
MANVAVAAAAAAAAGRDPAVDRSLRSVFVGNIPYEATEEQLKDIFSEVGLVVSFRLVYDRETGKPKGYGFCEYQDQETALSAMRNLNGREFSGRALRVDNAASEKNKEELKSLGTGAPVIESPYGEPCQPEEAPESISRAVASLPPEQMFELMKQMKLCVQNSPQEARNMLLQNPQLAYALLQAQVVMRIVDPEIALKMLHCQTNIQPLIPNAQTVTVPGPQPLTQPNPPVSQAQPMNSDLSQFLSGVILTFSNFFSTPLYSPSLVPMGDPRAQMRGAPPVATVVPPRGLLGDGPNDPRGGTLHSVTGEVVEPSRAFMNAPPHQGPQMHISHDGRGPPPDMRAAHDIRGAPMVEQRVQMGEPRGMIVETRGGPMMDQRGPPIEARGVRDPRAGEARGIDARGPAQAPRVPLAGGMQGPGPHAMGAGVPQPSRQSQVTPQDHEKAALIMQVLQLTPEQIAMLPPEQRQSILILKEQIQKSAGAP